MATTNLAARTIEINNANGRIVNNAKDETEEIEMMRKEEEENHLDLMSGNYVVQMIDEEDEENQLVQSPNNADDDAKLERLL